MEGGFPNLAWSLLTSVLLTGSEEKPMTSSDSGQAEVAWDPSWGPSGLCDAEWQSRELPLSHCSWAQALQQSGTGGRAGFCKGAEQPGGAGAGAESLGAGGAVWLSEDGL